MRVFLAMLLAAVTLVACVSPPVVISTPTAVSAGSCLPAARRAVELEIQRYQNWLQNENDPVQSTAYQERLRELNRLQQRLDSISPTDYHPADFFNAIPQAATGASASAAPIVLDEAWLDNGEPPQVHFPQQTRSGPFYIVTGSIVDPLPEAEKRVRLTLQPVLPQSYLFPSFYVCIIAVDEQ